MDHRGTVRGPDLDPWGMALSVVMLLLGVVVSAVAAGWSALNFLIGAFTEQDLRLVGSLVLMVTPTAVAIWLWTFLRARRPRPPWLPVLVASGVGFVLSLVALIVNAALAF